jgi:hypothetical protein
VKQLTVKKNRAGVPMAPGTDIYENTYYCGRKLGPQAIPQTDGKCGPPIKSINGTQCADCKFSS